MIYEYHQRIKVNVPLLRRWQGTPTIGVKGGVFFLSLQFWVDFDASAWKYTWTNRYQIEHSLKTLSERNDGRSLLTKNMQKKIKTISIFTSHSESCSHIYSTNLYYASGYLYIHLHILNTHIFLAPQVFIKSKRRNTMKCCRLRTLKHNVANFLCKSIVVLPFIKICCGYKSFSPTRKPLKCIEIRHHI